MLYLNLRFCSSGRGDIWTMHCRQVLRILEACNNSERQKTTRRLLHTVLYSSQLNSSKNSPLFYHFYLTYNDRNIMCLWPWCESNTWKNILLFSSRLGFFFIIILHTSFLLTFALYKRTSCFSEQLHFWILKRFLCKFSTTYCMCF